jgi:hypothetical protein
MEEVCERLVLVAEWRPLVLPIVDVVIHGESEECKSYVIRFSPGFRALGEDEGLQQINELLMPNGSSGTATDLR